MTHSIIFMFSFMMLPVKLTNMFANLLQNIYSFPINFKIT